MADEEKARRIIKQKPDNIMISTDEDGDTIPGCYVLDIGDEG